eukprot:TRINITY_DN32046_c0_g1_i1.p1 TRINITY_DN32046_c0_g1~~TRINITY_DN32046_c0_g1_i1.p1  ORF type:complete len:306 (+),score=69.30 TRINITY_DN32046_c0_g1_i1:55-972(+)
MSGLLLFVRHSVSGDTVPLELGTDATVQDVQQALPAEFGKCILTFGGAELADAAAELADLGISQEATVEATPHLPPAFTMTPRPQEGEPSLLVNRGSKPIPGTAVHEQAERTLVCGGGVLSRTRPDTGFPIPTLNLVSAEPIRPGDDWWVTVEAGAGFHYVGVCEATVPAVLDLTKPYRDMPARAVHCGSDGVTYVSGGSTGMSLPRMAFQQGAAVHLTCGDGEVRLRAGGIEKSVPIGGLSAAAPLHWIVGMPETGSVRVSSFPIATPQKRHRPPPPPPPPPPRAAAAAAPAAAPAPQPPAGSG